MKKLLLMAFASALLPSTMKATVGDVFTVKVGDVDMTFRVIQEGGGNEVSTGNWTHCIDWDYEGDVEVPATVQNDGKEYTVTEIGSSSFASCHYNSIKLPSTITSIRRYAFAYSWRKNWEESIQPITIPASTLDIEEGAFGGLTTTAINVEEGNPNYASVDGVLFDKQQELLLQYPVRKSGDTYTIPSTVKRIGYMAMRENTLTSVTVPSSVTELGEEAFAYSYFLSSITIPASVSKIEGGAFSGCSNATINLDSSNPYYTIVNDIVYSKDLNELNCYPATKTDMSFNIPEGTNTIFDRSFLYAKLQSVVIPNTVSAIGLCAFFGSALTSVDIPESVTKIGSQAFDYCSNLEKVYLHSATPPATEWNVFGGNENLTVYVPYASLAAYKNVENLTRAHIDPSLDWHGEHWFWIFSCVEGIDFTKSEGLTAYKVVKNSGSAASRRIGVSTRTESDSPVSFVPVDKAGPGDCVLLVGEPGHTYELHSDETAANITDNLLTGATEATSISATDGDKTNYVFNGTEFVQVSASEGITAGAGFLQIPTADVPAGSNTISVSSIPTATSINSAKVGKSTTLYYNLNGQQVAHPTKGVFISNGQKVVVK